MTVVEVLLSMSISGVIISVALTFMAQPDEALQGSLDRTSAAMTARRAVTLLSEDIGGLSANTRDTVPLLIHAEPNVVTFSTDSTADILSFFFVADSSTSRDDDFVLYRQLGGTAPEVVARHLARDGSEPFFTFDPRFGASVVGVTLVATNGLVGKDERSVRMTRRIALPAAGP